MLVTPNHFMALSTSKYEISWMWQPSKRAAMCSTTLSKNAMRHALGNLRFCVINFQNFQEILEKLITDKSYN